MSDSNQSLFEIFPRKYYIPTLLALSVLSLLLGLFLPVITLKELILFKSTFSILTGIQGMFHEGHYILAMIIFLFSIIFPLFKLFILITVWFSHLATERKAFFIHWLGILGKWSMLDVFVVAVTIVITKISKFASAEPRIGIYFFTISIIIAMFVTEKIESKIKLIQDPPEDEVQTDLGSA